MYLWNKSLPNRVRTQQPGAALQGPQATRLHHAQPRGHLGAEMQGGEKGFAAAKLPPSLGARGMMFMPGEARPRCTPASGPISPYPALPRPPQGSSHPGVPHESWGVSW